MKIIQEQQYDFNDLMLKPKRSELGSRADVNLIREFKGKWNPNLNFSCTPIVCANMDNIANWETMKVLHKFNLTIAMNKFIPIEEWSKMQNILNDVNPFFYTIGIRNEDELNNYRKLYNKHPDIFNKLCIDVPNAYSVRFINFVRKVRNEFPSIYIMAGNVVSAEQTEELILAGSDCVKCGIGSGSNCISRKKAGVGRPQASVVIESSDAAHGLNAHICSDGGCNSPGDIIKSFCLGSDFVMLGGMFGGHLESEGKVIEKYEVSHYTKDLKPVFIKKEYKEFWGMSSERAMKIHYGEMASYRSSEGRTTLIPYRGPLENTIKDILGGIRSGLTYIGAKKIKDAPKCASFYIVKNQLNNPYKNIS